MTWNIKDKTVFITGATDGIGRAAALELARRGAHLVLTARTSEKGGAIVEELKKKTNNPHVNYLLCDLASFASIQQCAQEYQQRFQTLHVFISVAGVMPLERQESQDSIELNMAVNYFAPVLLEELLLPMIKKSVPARIINVTSSLHSKGVIELSDLKGGGLYDRYRAYATSKLALMLYTFKTAQEYAHKGVSVYAVHPGWIRTKLAVGALGKSNPLLRFLFPFLKMRSPAYGADSIVYLATDPKADEYAGAYIIKSKPSTPSQRAQDPALAERLFTETKKILSPYLR